MRTFRRSSREKKTIVCPMLKYIIENLAGCEQNEMNKRATIAIFSISIICLVVVASSSLFIAFAFTFVGWKFIIICRCFSNWAEATWNLHAMIVIECAACVLCSYQRYKQWNSFHRATSLLSTIAIYWHLFTNVNLVLLWIPLAVAHNTNENTNKRTKPGDTNQNTGCFAQCNVITVLINNRFFVSSSIRGIQLFQHSMKMTMISKWLIWHHPPSTFYICR